jgi:HKD family nuclease
MATIELLRHGREMGSRLAEDLVGAQRVCIAVSRAESSVLSVVDLVSFVKRGGELLLLAGTDGYGTETAFLRRFDGYPGARCRIHHAFPGAGFQPCMFVVDKPQKRLVYVGSSNLTGDALKHDVSVNVRIEGDPTEPELERPMRLFEEFFWSELSLPMEQAFLDEYEALRSAHRAAIEKSPDRSMEEQLGWAVARRLGEHRGRAAAGRHLLVVTAKNYAVCLATMSFGRRRQAELERYAKGDPFFFHVTGRGRGLRAMGMFVGEAYRDENNIYRAMDGGAQLFRKKFVILGELKKEVGTRSILESLRKGSPKNWFNGFVQDSHRLSMADFEALRTSFWRAFAKDRGMDVDS